MKMLFQRFNPPCDCDEALDLTVSVAGSDRGWYVFICRKCKAEMRHPIAGTEWSWTRGDK